MVNPPKEGDESYPLYKEEYDGIYNGLKKRAIALHEAFKEMEGVSCQDPQVCEPLFGFVLFICPFSLVFSIEGVDAKYDMVL